MEKVRVSVRLTQILPVALLLAVACSDAPFASPPPASSAYSLRLGENERPLASIEEEFAEIAAAAPEFAGVYLSKTGEPVVMVAGDTSDVALRSTAVERVARRSGAFTSLAVARVRRAEFSFALLSEHRETIRQIVRTSNARVGLGIDIERNLITIRGSTLDIKEVRHRARIQGVPDGAVEFLEDSVIQGVSLRGVVRPVTGGLSISFASDPNTYCSAGLQAWKNDSNGYPDVSQGRYLLTASHCTGEKGVVTGVTFGQPHRGHGHHATEVWDAPVITGGSCFYSLPCQMVDVAVLRMVDSVASTWQRVAKSNTSSPPTYLGQISLNVSVWSAVQGQLVRRVGARTGQRDGTVVHACYDLYVDGRYLLCQVEVQGFSNGGDSGGPVYTPLQAQYPDSPWRSGIYHSYNPAQTHYWFSSVGAILTAFGGAYTI